MSLRVQEPPQHRKIDYYWYDHVILVLAILFILVLSWLWLSGTLGSLILP